MPRKYMSLGYLTDPGLARRMRSLQRFFSERLKVKVPMSCLITALLTAGLEKAEGERHGRHRR